MDAPTRTLGTPPELPTDYTVAQVATSLGMSVRWLRGLLSEGAVEHERRGNRIRFTAAQVDKLRTSNTQHPRSDGAA